MVDSSIISAKTGSNVELTLKTPLSKNVLVFVSLRGQEQLSQLYSYELTLSSTKPQDVKIEDVLGHPVTVELKGDGVKRKFSGIVSHFGCTHSYDGRSFFKATLVPKAWLMTRQGMNRCWENVKATGVIKDVIGEAGLDSSVDASNVPVMHENLLQYGETNFDLVSRLMEEEGLYYYFEHEDNNQKWHIVDSENPTAVTFTYGIDGCEVTHTQQIQPNAMTLHGWDHVKKEPVNKPSGSYPDQGMGELKLEDYISSSMSSGGHVLKDKDYTKVRMEELQSQTDMAHGTLEGALLNGPGMAIEFVDYPCDAINKKYLITSVTYEIAASETPTDKIMGVELNCGFTAIDAEKPFRPARTTPKPMIQGPRTALVTNTADPDKLGRVKVKYPWMPDYESWWIRVAQVWAGKDHGAIFIPHVGDEVVVEFEDGDPNQPIIIGSVYNGKDKLPPDCKDDGVKDRGMYNEQGSKIFFNDEDVNVVAQKDYNIEVVVGEAIVTVEKGDHKLEAKDPGSKCETIAGDCIALKVGSNSIKITKTGIELKVGSSSVKLENSGVTIKGLEVLVAGDLKTEVKGLEVSVAADLKAEVKGAMVDVNGSGMTNVKGGLVMIN